MAILISDKTNFRIREIIRGKEDRYIMINVSDLQKDITTLNGDSTNVRVLNIGGKKSGRTTEKNRQVSGLQLKTSVFLIDQIKYG